MTLFAIQCRFKATEDSEYVDGLAICSDVNTPITFIHPDGKPLISNKVWDYNLKHYCPWVQVV